MIFIIKRAVLKWQRNTDRSYAYADRLSTQRRNDLAIIVFQDTLSFAPNHAETHMGLGKLLWDRAKSANVDGAGFLDTDEQIRSHFEEALQCADPGDVDFRLEVLYQLCLFSAREEDYRRAISISQQMLDLDPSLDAIRMDLVGYYCNIEDYRGAVSQYVALRSTESKRTDKARAIIERYATYWDKTENKYKKHDFDQLLADCSDQKER